MKIKLYPCFEHWKKYESIYLYSDPHFGDSEMSYFRKNNITDEEQVRRINSKIHKNDIIIFLGDIGNIEFIKKINGYKVLIMGNHDTGITNYQRKIDRKYFSNQLVVGSDEEKLYEKLLFDGYKARTELDFNTGQRNFYLEKDNKLFDEVYDGPIMISDKILLSHEPILLPFCFNFHGHDHNNIEAVSNHSLNLCAEHINYFPINLIEQIKSGILSDIKSIHRQTIDNAIVKSKNK